MITTEEAAARRLLRRCYFGVLATQSKKYAGYPFGSVVPYAVAHDGSLIILISRLAEHTRNVAADAKVSLTVFENGHDVQAEPRATVLGDCRRIDADDQLRDRYVRLHPDASEHLRLDFDFHQIEPLAVRFIGGFGAIRWVSRSLLAVRDPIAVAESWLLAQIEEMHREQLVAICGHITGREPATIRIAAVDGDGLDVRADGRLLRIDFPEPREDPAGVLRSIAALIAGHTR